MNRVSFTAKTITYEIIKDTHFVCISPASGKLGYCILSRVIQGISDDEGVYLEFFHELASGYDLVSILEMHRDKIIVSFKKPFVKITGIDIALDIDDASFEKMIDGINNIFQDKTDQVVNYTTISLTEPRVRGPVD